MNMEKLNLDALDRLRRNPFYLLLLPVALMFISFTQLRFSLSVGPGEIMLAAWIAVTLVACVRFSAPFTPFAKKTTAVMLISLASGVIGSIWAFIMVYSKQGLPWTFVNEAVGTVFDVLVCIAFVLIADREFVNKSMRIFCIMSTFIYLYNFIFVSSSERVKDLNRLKIWSNNPNQTALYCYVLAALCFIILMYERKLIRFLYALCFIAQVVMGLATDSDGLYMSYIMLAVIFIVFLLAFNMDKVFSWLALAGGMAALLLFNQEVMDFIVSLQDRADFGGQTTTRFELWRVAMQGYLYSPIFGNGFGMHAGTVVPFSGLDVHNFIIDYLVRFGAVGLGALLIWIGTIIKQILKYKKIASLTVLFAFMPLALTHAVYRMPVFFVFLLALYYMSTPQEVALDEHCKELDRAGRSWKGAHNV